MFVLFSEKMFIPLLRVKSNKPHEHLKSSFTELLPIQLSTKITNSHTGTGVGGRTPFLAISPVRFGGSPPKLPVGTLMFLIMSILFDVMSGHQILKIENKQRSRVFRVAALYDLVRDYKCQVI